MTKKEYLLTVLDKLTGVWEYAKGLHIILSQTEVSQTVIDGLYDIISAAVKATTSEVAQIKLEKWMAIVHKLAESHSFDQAKLDKQLEDMLADME